MSNLGLHISTSREGLQSSLLYYKNKGLSNLQIFASSPRRFEVSPVQPFSIPDLNIVVHGPFVVSLVKDDAQHYCRSLKCLINLSKVCSTINSKYLVTHIGGIKEGQSFESGVKTLINFCMDWVSSTEDDGTILCLETDPGSSTGRKIGSLTLLYKVVSYLNHPRIKICLDTEHSFANGFDLNNYQVKYLLDSNQVAVIHLNSIPSNVKQGGHLDRHSDCLIKDGQHSDRILYTYKIAKEYNIPCILERSLELGLQEFYDLKEV